MKKVWYIDSTLRDGEQAPGVSFTKEEKMNIAVLLNKLEVNEVEVGTPAIGEKEVDIIRSISNAGFTFKTTSWCRAKNSDVLAARKASTDGINLSFPVSNCQLTAMNKNLGWVLDTMTGLIPYTKDYFKYTAIGLQDASRADYNNLKEIIGLAIFLGANRIRIADTVGVLNPLQTYRLFSRLTKDYSNFDFEFHGHNDLGMATANTVAAVLSGAKSVSCTVNGLGERAGNAPIDEIVMALQHSCGVKSELNTYCMQEISDYIAACSGRKIPESKPVTGKVVYTHESGIHTNLLLSDRSTYQIINPKQIGQANDKEIVFGKHSGSAALHDFYVKQGVNLTKEHLLSILSQIKVRAEMKKTEISTEELMEMYYQLT